jgi:N-acetylglutamate synthase-like GNAT family acetyltransferase
MKSDFPGLKFEETTREDIPALTKIMTKAFDDDTLTYRGIEKGGPAGYDNGDFFRKWLFTFKETRGFKAVLDGQIVGSIIVWIYPHGKNILGNIFVNPEYQSRGIGKALWNYIEKSYPEAKSWVLTTPEYSIRNHYFYEKTCGFTKVDEVPCPEGPWKEFVYRKTIRP